MLWRFRQPAPRRSSPLFRTAHSFRNNRASYTAPETSSARSSTPLRSICPQESTPAPPVRIAHKRCTRRNRGRHDELRILGQSQTRASGRAIRTAPVSHNGLALLAALHIAIIRSNLRSNPLPHFTSRQRGTVLRGRRRLVPQPTSLAGEAVFDSLVGGGGGAFLLDRSAAEWRVGAVRFDLCFSRHNLPFAHEYFCGVCGGAEKRAVSG